MPLKILILNVQGLNSFSKKKIAFNYLHFQRRDLACLQETHFSTSSTPRFFHLSFSLVYMASATTKHRGLLIAFCKVLNFACQKQFSDPQGRYLFLQGTLHEYPCDHIRLLCPQCQHHILPFSSPRTACFSCQGSLFPLWRFQLNHTSNHRQILWPCHWPHPDSKCFLERFIKAGLVDACKELHSLLRDYTYFSSS